jgi:hypothetical protein
LIVIHSDGGSGRHELAPLVTAAGHDLQALADSILAQWGHITDDATAVIASPLRNPS